MSNKALDINCPICNKKIFWSEEFPDRPFCSERCRLIDLGEWASEMRVIPGKSLADELLSDDVEQIQNGQENF